MLFPRCLIFGWLVFQFSQSNLYAQKISSRSAGKVDSTNSQKFKETRIQKYLFRLNQKDLDDSLVAFRRNLNKELLLGNKEFDAENYYFAIEHYKEALNSLKDDGFLFFRIAQCYRLAQESKMALGWYQKAIKTKFSNNFIHLEYGNLLRAFDEFSKAEEQYLIHLEKYPEDANVKWLLESMKLGMDWIKQSSRYSVENIEKFNTKYSEFGIAPFKNNGIVLSSTRPESVGNGKFGRLGEDFSDLFESYLDGEGKWSRLTSVLGEINTPNNEGTPGFTSDGNTIYFTRCQQLKGGCRIYVSSREPTGWTKPIKLSVFGDTVEVGQVSVSSKGDKIYFTAAPIEGGFGGKDIWFMNYLGEGQWEEPINLGANVNTAGNDMFPFIHASDTLLFFSSDGHPGIGGLDIFKTTGAGTEWEPAENMRSPINSGADDFGLTANRKARSGFLCSNRVNGKGSDDVYLWNKIPYKLQLSGKIYDDTSGKALPNSVIRLMMEDSTYIETRSDSLGYYSFKLREELKYKLLVSMPKELIPDNIHLGRKKLLLYYPADTSFNTIDTKDDVDMRIDMAMHLIPTDEVLLTDIMYDYDSSSLRPISMLALDSLIRFLNRSPNISIAIHSHTDSRGSDQYNLALSQRRAESVVNYLISRGIGSERLTALGHGESKLINRCRDKVKCPDEDHQLNRRTSFSITAIDLDRMIVKYRRVTGEETENPEESIYTFLLNNRPTPRRGTSRP